MRFIKGTLATLVLLSIFATLAPLQGQAATGVWFTPKYQDAFVNTVDMYTDGLYIGRKLPDSKSIFPLVTLYTNTMKPIVTTKFHEYGYRTTGFHDGLMAVGKYVLDSNGMQQTLYGYIDKKGNEVIPANYTYASDFNKGLAIVHQTSGEKESTLLINNKGEAVLRFDAAMDGQVRDDYIYFDAGTHDTTSWPVQPDADRALYYDFTGKPITSGSRYGATGPTAYYNEEGKRTDAKRLNPGVTDAFVANFGSLYNDSSNLGDGFFLVSPKTAKFGDPGTNDWDVQDDQQVVRHSVVDKNNKVIIPLGEMEVTPFLTESSVFFVVHDTGSKKLLSGIYGPSGKLLVKGDYYVFYAGNGAIYYYAEQNKGWGLISVTGTPILKYGKNFICAFDYATGGLNSFNDFYAYAPNAFVTFFTAANMNEKGDVIKLKALVAKAAVQLKTISPKSYSGSDYTRIKTRMTNNITYAKAVIASKNPTWVDISSLENALLWSIFETVPGDDKVLNY